MYRMLTHPEELREAFIKRLESPDFKPPMLPTVATELMRLSADPDVSFSRINQFLHAEPVLAARVLRLAQSPFYSRGVRIETIEDAITRLGLRTLVELFIQESMTTRVFRSPSYQEPMETLRRHSVATANLAKLVCEKCQLPVENAFLAGLLHDIGYVVGILTVVELVGRHPPPFEVVARVIGELQEELSELIAKAWNLPEPVQLVVGKHNRPNDAVTPLYCAVRIADSIASQIGYGAGYELNSADAVIISKAQQHLGLSNEDLASLLGGPHSLGVPFL